MSTGYLANRVPGQQKANKGPTGGQANRRQHGPIGGQWGPMGANGWPTRGQQGAKGGQFGGNEGPTVGKWGSKVANRR